MSTQYQSDFQPSTAMLVADAAQLHISDSDPVPVCTNHDPELWYPDPSDRAGYDEAVALCGTCPIRARCLAVATARREPAGIWGGVLFKNGRQLATLPQVGRPKKELMSA